MHSSHRIRHTIGSRACRHVIRMQRTACSTAGSNGEIFLALLDTFLLISTCNGMLESGRVGGVTGNRYIHAFLMHDRNTFGYIIRAVAVNLRTKACAVGFAENLFHFSCIIIHLGLDISKSIDSGNNLSGVFSKSV